MALKERIIETLGRKCEVIPEESPVGDHQANGEIENAIKELEKQIRVLKLGLEQKIQLVLKDDHPLMAWLPEYAGFLLSRFQVAADGKTAYERLKGKSYRRELVDYGEQVMFMPVVHGGKLSKLDTKWSFGRFCGIRPRTNEMYIMTPDGILKTRSVRRLPEPDRWKQDDWDNLSGVPWAHKPVRQKLPGIAPIPISDEPLPPQQAQPKVATRPCS